MSDRVAVIRGRLLRRHLDPVGWAQHAPGDMQFLLDLVAPRVVSAGDCEPCECCGEPICPACQEHYADCPCPGPHSV